MTRRSVMSNRRRRSRNPATATRSASALGSALSVGASGSLGSSASGAAAGSAIIGPERGLQLFDHRVISEVEPERRDRHHVVLDGVEVGAGTEVDRLLAVLQPVIGHAAHVLALVDEEAVGDAALRG